MGELKNWPFAVRVQATEPEGRLVVACRVPGADLLQARGRLALACEFFFALARQGAFRGAGEAPGSAPPGSLEPTFAVAGDREEVTVRGTCGRFDPLALGVLANLVESLLPEATWLSIALPVEFDPRQLAPGIYPAPVDPCPFSMVDESRDGNLEVRVDFVQAPGPPQRVHIEGALSDWWYASTLGAFREADQAAADSTALPPQSIEWDDNSLSFTLEKVRASAAMVEALVGIVVWIDRCIAAVASLDIG